MFKLAIVGFGAIGQELARVLQADENLQVAQIVTTARSASRAMEAAAQSAPTARVVESIDTAVAHPPDLVVECAGHAALLEHVVPALSAGIPAVVASVGALAVEGLHARLEEAARQGQTTVQLVAGAIGAIDALDAARIGGLDRVRYTGRKPPRSWLGTPAEQACDLAALTAACVVFRGSAREAAIAFPKNANVAATVALAGIGLDRTEVELIADPAVAHNVHRIEASGRFGELDLRMQNLPLAANPKTSALTVYSLARSVRRALAPVGF